MGIDSGRSCLLLGIIRYVISSLFWSPLLMSSRLRCNSGMSSMIRKVSGGDVTV